MAEGGHDPRGPNMDSSSEQIIARDKVLADGDKVSQNFENTTVNVVAGDQNIQTINDGQAQRGQDTTEPPGPNAARHAKLAECDQVAQRFENSTVNVVAGDQHVTNVINEPSESSENRLTQERLRLEAEIAFLAKTRQHLRNKVGEHEMPARLTTMVIDMQTANDADFKNARHGDHKTLFGSDVEPINLVQFHDPLKGTYPRHVMILGEAGAGKTTISGMYCLAVADGQVKTLSTVQLVHYVQAANLDNPNTANALDLLFTEQMAHDPMTELTPREERAGANWLKDNPHKLLLAIDGLDQCLDDFSAKHDPRSSRKNKSSVNQIIASIMAGTLWRGARILTTSRWNIYWNLPVEQKPDKVIGMRGFDDENLKLAASLASVDGDKLINRLLNTSPKLLNLCRNPMFLKYTTKIFQTDPDNLPDSISGLMAIFFRNFFRLSVENYDDITRLAYDGMLKNIFVFTRRYLKNFGINPNDLDDFLSAGANPERGRDIANPFDGVFTFAHQTMQEFCCALHVPSLDLREMKKFIANHLNESGMELTRQLLYGLILNEKVTNPMREYLKGQKTAIQECREIMFEQLLGMVKNGTIREIHTVRLLSECGDDTIQKMKEHVQQIAIHAEDLLHSDQLLLASMIKRLSPLKTTFVKQITLDPSMVSYMKDCLESVDTFEAGYEIMDSVEERHFSDVMTILNQSELLHVRLRCNDDVKLLFLADWIKRTQVQLDNLGLLGISRVDTLKNLFKFLSIHSLRVLRLNINSRIIGSQFTDIVTSQGSVTRKVDSMTIEDKFLTDEKIEAYFNIFLHCQFKGLNLDKCDLNYKDIDMIMRGCRTHGVELLGLTIRDSTMPSDAYFGLAAVVQFSGCAYLNLGNCELSRKKLECFEMGCKENQVSLETLGIGDNSMKEDGYEILTHILKLSGCNELALTQCCLTKTKLQEVVRGCWDQNIQLRKLIISDRTMPSDAYSDVASVIKVTKCTEVQFSDCDLSVGKLNRFRRSCKDMKVSFPELGIFDSIMPSDAYHDLAAVVKVSKCSYVHFGNCELSKEKLKCFEMGCKENQVSLQKLGIGDNSMKEDGYEIFAYILKLSGCKELVLEQCCLTNIKLQEIMRGCRNQNIQLPELTIVDSTMPSDVYPALAAVLKVSKCAFVQFLNCELSRKKLKFLEIGCQINQVSLQKLGIIDNSMTEDGYEILTRILKLSGCKEVVLEQCCLTKTKLQELLRGCRDQNIQLQKLVVMDRTMPLDAYSEVAAVIKATKCAHVQFNDCNLSKEKLQCFRMSCKESQVSLSNLSIIDTKMSVAAYRQIAFTLKSIGCKRILFRNCELTTEKLSEVYRGCEDSDLSLSKLTIWDGAMTSDVYCVIADIISITGRTQVCFVNCGLTEQKLVSFGAAGRKNRISLSSLQVKDAEMPADAYREMAATLKSIGCKDMQFHQCDLTRRKLSEFYTGSTDNDLSLTRLIIDDSKMPPDAYYDVAAIAKAIQRTDLHFDHCGLSSQKLEFLGMGCRYGQVLIPKLTIDWSHSTATEDDISALCDLMTFAVEKITLLNWNIDVEGTRRLKDTLQLENSKAISLRIPNGDTFPKRQPEETPTGHATLAASQRNKRTNCMVQ